MDTNVPNEPNLRRVRGSARRTLQTGRRGRLVLLAASPTCLAAILLAACSAAFGGDPPAGGPPGASAKPTAANPPARQIGPPDWIDVFGVKEGKPLNKGFVFFNGRYLEAPYRVSRRGVGIYVNDTRLPESGRGSGGWPPVGYDYEDKDPGVPPGLTRKSTFADLDFKDKPGDSWDRKKIRWLSRHYAPKEVERLTIQYFKELPFVAKVEQKEPNVLRVTTFGGEEEIIGLDEGPPSLPPTKEQMLKEMERIRARLEGRLLKGDCFLMFSNGGELSFGEQKAAKDLPLAVEVLSGSKTAAEKTDLLQRMYILGPSPEPFQSLVTRFQPSAQLNERLRELGRQTGIKPRTVQELPAEPQWRAEERAHEAAEALEKELLKKKNAKPE